MRRSILFATVALLPSVAFAQQPQMSAVATAGVQASAPTTSMGAGGQKVLVPPGMPPAAKQLAPNPPLLAKESYAASESANWRNRNDRPTRGEDGTLIWRFGASQPSVVCAPLRACDIALHAGETVRNINLGDKVRWKIDPGVTGVGANRVTHIVVKPVDSGLVTDLMVYTDERLYSIKLISTQAQYTAMTGFSYPSDDAQEWQQYGATVTSSHAATASYSNVQSSVGGPGVEFYHIEGSASWKPEHVYTAGGKTIIEFPSSIRFGSAPAIVGLANDGGWFSSPSQQMVRYRVEGNKYVVDGVLDRAMLVLGVGGAQQKVTIRRAG